MKRLTTRHGEIRNLGMPAMTMVFQIHDGVMLDRLKAGDKVRFKAEDSGSGLVVIAVKAVK
ncbi:MAG: copper-binding protein [Rubrivivax sp.]|nr:copper-binding protein [Rubrivivax sp.]